MKILSVKERGEMFVYTTDNKDRPEFVYPKDRFNSLDEVSREIELSIKLEEHRKKASKSKVDKISIEISAVKQDA